MKICFISRGYPFADDSAYSFVKVLVDRLADFGNECVIIAPQTINGRSRAGKLRKTKWSYKTDRGNTVSVFQPLHFSFGPVKIFGKHLTTYFRTKAINKAVKKNVPTPQLFYGHFWDCGFYIAKYAKKNNIPVVVANGEGYIYHLFDFFSKAYIDNYIDVIKGVICVSSDNKKESAEWGLIKSNQKVIVSPNCVDTSVFRPLVNENLKNKFNIREDDFVISFVGSFCERKGDQRLVKAIENIDNVKLILIGGEKKEYSGNSKIVFCGKVPHNEIPEYLSASDVFCLPTLAEGCCNAIVEAMACKLPVISSNLPFNDDILDDSCSIRVNPKSIDEISNAIIKLRDNKELCAKMAQNAYDRAQSLTIENRAKEINDFLNSL